MVPTGSEKSRQMRLIICIFHHKCTLSIIAYVYRLEFTNHNIVSQSSTIFSIVAASLQVLLVSSGSTLEQVLLFGCCCSFFPFISEPSTVRLPVGYLHHTPCDIGWIQRGTPPRIRINTQIQYAYRKYTYTLPYCMCKRR